MPKTSVSASLVISAPAPAIDAPKPLIENALIVERASFALVAFASTVVSVVIKPLSSARTAPLMEASPTNTPPVKPPNESLSMSARALFVKAPLALASMRTAPEEVIEPVKSASMSAVVAISAFALIPERPPIAMLKTFASAVASFVPSASTVT